mmetsp:Transcript_42554/g.66662  ORF Transcript_42554/g.66662 Transcript_42554/m.66662 type:complete len:117 (-) Transcript_42554:40-390(-)
MTLAELVAQCRGPVGSTIELRLKKSDGLVFLATLEREGLSPSTPKHSAPSTPNLTAQSLSPSTPQPPHSPNPPRLDLSGGSQPLAPGVEEPAGAKEPAGVGDCGEEEGSAPDIATP